MKKLHTFVLLGAATCLALPALAQFNKAEDAIKYRQSAFFILQQNFGRVAGMANGKIAFDAKAVADSAATAEFVGKLPWAAYGPAMDQGPSKSKPEIWANKAKFDDLAKQMQAELSKLNAAAQSGNQDNIKSAVVATADTCKSCHREFRSR